MGRPPTIADGELVAALQAVLDWPVVAAVDTDTVVSEIGSIHRQTVRNRLRAARRDEDVPIEGVRPGGQGGWVWWLTDTTLYET